MRESLLDLDRRLTARLRVAEQPGFLRSAGAVLAHSGDSWFWGLALVIVWAIGPDVWRRRATIMLAGIFISATLVLLIKFTVRRRRPEGQWGGIYRSTDPHSFPSGHAARAVLLAVLAIGLGPAPFAVLMAVWAPLVALARVAMGLHYLSDIAAGAVLGGLVGVLLLSQVWFL